MLDNAFRKIFFFRIKCIYMFLYNVHGDCKCFLICRLKWDLKKGKHFKLCLQHGIYDCSFDSSLSSQYPTNISVLIQGCGIELYKLFVSVLTDNGMLEFC